MSHLESLTMICLENKNIKFEYQCNKNTFHWLNKQSLDFYLPEYNIAIECQGIQHYKPIDYFGGKKAFEYRKKLDENKKELCRQNGVDIIYINNEFEISEKLNGM